MVRIQRREKGELLVSNDIMYKVPKDDRYATLSAHDLKVIRKNMIEHGGFTKYEFALVQFWIMQKEGRLPTNI